MKDQYIARSFNQKDVDWLARIKIPLEPILNPKHDNLALARKRWSEHYKQQLLQRGLFNDRGDVDDAAFGIHAMDGDIPPEPGDVVAPVPEKITNGRITTSKRKRIPLSKREYILFGKKIFLDPNYLVRISTNQTSLLRRLCVRNVLIRAKHCPVNTTGVKHVSDRTKTAPYRHLGFFTF
jgi:hypothetical protein